MPFYRDYFPPSTPIATKGGIKARSKRGAFATRWWAQRWLSVLEALNLGGRLQRGRSYARKGQVLDIAIEPGSVRAEVQGSRPRPYVITIGVKPLQEKQTRQLAAEIAKAPYFLAKLMTGEMPEDIETLFHAARVSLFPARAGELHTECSCPDWSNPCKHIAAVYYLLGEEFDRDPFLIFRLRGIDTAELLAGLETGGEELAIEPEEDIRSLAQGAPPPESFWEGTRPEVDLTAIEADPASTAPLVRRLGNLPFWKGELALIDALEPAYAAAGTRALDLLAGAPRRESVSVTATKRKHPRAPAIDELR
jgi:uncharacterized Zn finger protein